MRKAIIRGVCAAVGFLLFIAVDYAFVVTLMYLASTYGHFAVVAFVMGLIAIAVGAGVGFYTYITEG